MKKRSCCNEFGTEIRGGTSGWIVNLGQVVLWPTYYISYITDLSEPFITKWFLCIINDFHTFYMIYSFERAYCFLPRFHDRFDKLCIFRVRIRFWQEWTIYHFNCTYATNSNIYLRTQSKLNLMRNNEDSEGHFLLQKKTHSQKTFPVVPDQAVA
jgi:hypothetical protein